MLYVDHFFEMHIYGGIEKAFLLQTHLSNHTLEMLASISYFEPRCPFKKAKQGHTTITLLGSDLRRKISRQVTQSTWLQK